MKAKKTHFFILGALCLMVVVNSCKKKKEEEAAKICTPPSPPTAKNNGPVGYGENLDLTADYISGGSYFWRGPNGFTSTSQNPSLVFGKGKEGDYSVTVTVDNCTSEAYHTYVTNCEIVAASDSAGVPTNSFTGGTKVDLTASSILDYKSSVVNANYSWTGPNGFVSAVQNPVISAITPAATGTYSVTATTASGHKSQEATVTIYIKPVAPTASNNSPAVGAQLDLKAQTIAGATQYDWTGPNGFTSNVQNPSIPNATRAMAGTYYVTYVLNGATSRVGKTIVSISYSSVGCSGQTSVTYKGYTYNVVEIGNQCWTTSNMKSSKTGNDSAYDHTSAVNGSIIINQGVCPDGWHIPSDSVFQVLTSLVANDGNALKATTEGSGAGAGTNTSGFSALLNLGSSTNKTAVFWSTTDLGSAVNGQYMKLYYGSPTIYLGSDLKSKKYYVRCIKD